MKLNISFTDQTESFVLGCEYGRILERLEKGIEIVENNGFPVHIKNKQTIIQSCNHFGYTPIFGNEHFGTYIEFRAIKNNNFN